MNFREELEKIREEKNKEYNSEKNAEEILQNTINLLKGFSHITFNSTKSITFWYDNENVKVERNQTELYKYECQDEVDARQTIQIMKQKLEGEGIKFKHSYNDGFTISISVDK